MLAFRRYLLGLQGRLVQLERGGPEARRGFLLSVAEDYLTLGAENGGQIHLPLHHIRSITPLPPPEAGACPPPTTTPPATFTQLLDACRDQSVRLYHAGPEACAGILGPSTDDHVFLKISDEVTVCYTVFHIRSLYPLGEADPPAAETGEPPQKG